VSCIGPLIVFRLGPMPFSLVQSFVKCLSIIRSWKLKVLNFQF